MKSILVCPVCNRFTLIPTCKQCSIPTESVRPIKYSPEDKYHVYRRQAQEDGRKKRGLL